MPIAVPKLTIGLQGAVLRRLDGPVDPLGCRFGGEGVAVVAAEVPLLGSLIQVIDTGRQGHV